jgi:ribosomal protein S12 methylthiotransferase
MKKYSIISLGCSKNLVDSEVFSYIMENSNFSYTENLLDAHIIIVNTCGFIQDAKIESIESILEAAEYKNKGICEKLIVTGCLVKRYFEDIKQSIPEIDHLIDLKDFKTFSKIFSSKLIISRKLLTPSHYAYLRISDGCNNCCSYCAIPLIRGNLKSVPIEKLVKEAEFLADKGVKELILTAQDTCQYGVDIYKSPKLIELLNKLHEIKGIEWIRILYLHPAHITSEIIDTFAGLTKIRKYFDIPFQHINDQLLKSMNRKVHKKKIINILEEIKTKIPEAAIRTTFIVGYPEETHKKFMELKEFIKEQKFLRLGIFSYSKEENTMAFDLPGKVSQKTSEKRKDELMTLQESISTELLMKFIGKKIKVIIDQKSDNKDFRFEGRSYLDAPEIDGTVFISEGDIKVGDIVEVEIIDSWEYDLIGKII